MDVGKLYRLKYTPRQNPSSPSARKLKGSIFTALVLEFTKKEGETAVVLEWKEAPLGASRGIKDKRQTLTHSDFETDYQVMPRGSADAPALAAAAASK